MLLRDSAVTSLLLLAVLVPLLRQRQEHREVLARQQRQERLELLARQQQERLDRLSAEVRYDTPPCATRDDRGVDPRHPA